MITYKTAGVDIEAAGVFKKKVASLARKSANSNVLKEIGGFGSFFRFPKEKYRNPVLVSSSDGVGTKLKLAVLNNKHDTVGIDAVAMNVNDILCAGAEPLFFLDYIAYSNLEQDTLLQIVKGVNQGCIESECSLVGGETAQMPGMYKKGEYDLAGFCVGVVERDRIIDGNSIEQGNSLVGIESSGFHSNGFSLVRKVLSKDELKRYAGELIKPTRIYVKPVLSLINPQYRESRCIRGIAHITGGAFYDKVARILPDKLDARINKSSWPVPKLFRLLQNKGKLSDKVLYGTFNMGIGMVLVVESKAAGNIIQKLAGFRLKSWVIGEVVKGNKSVQVA